MAACMMEKDGGSGTHGEAACMVEDDDGISRHGEG